MPAFFCRPAAILWFTRNIGYGYVRNGAGIDRDYVMSGEYELEVATERVPCEVHMDPLYDPAMERIKA